MFNSHISHTRDGSLLVCGRISGAGQAMVLDPFNETAEFVAACPEHLKLCIELQTRQPAVLAATGNCRVYLFVRGQQAARLVDPGVEDSGNSSNEFVKKREKAYLPLARLQGAVLEFDMRSCLWRARPFPRAAAKLSDAHGNFAYLLTSGDNNANRIGVYCLRRHKVLRYLKKLPAPAPAPAQPPAYNPLLRRPLAGMGPGPEQQPAWFSHIRYISRLGLTLCIGCTARNQAFVALLKPNLTKTYSLLVFEVHAFLDSIAVVELQGAYFVPLFEQAGSKSFLLAIDCSDKLRPALVRCHAAGPGAPGAMEQAASQPRRLEASKSLSVAVLGSRVFLGKEGGIVEEFHIVPE